MKYRYVHIYIYPHWYNGKVFFTSKQKYYLFFKFVFLFFVIYFILLFCWMGVHYGIYIRSYNNGIKYTILISPLPPFSFITPPPPFLEQFQQVSVFPFTHMCICTTFPLLSPPTTTNSPGRTYSALLFSNFVSTNQKKSIFLRVIIIG
jgi:hypothetical protein